MCVVLLNSVSSSCIMLQAARPVKRGKPRNDTKSLLKLIRSEFDRGAVVLGAVVAKLDNLGIEVNCLREEQKGMREEQKGMREEQKGMRAEQKGMRSGIATINSTLGFMAEELVRTKLVRPTGWVDPFMVRTTAELVELCAPESAMLSEASIDGDLQMLRAKKLVAHAKVRHHEQHCTYICSVINAGIAVTEAYGGTQGRGNGCSHQGRAV
jgi:hypothetical protein